jgi:SAM-dependent methyltransferase
VTSPRTCRDGVLTTPALGRGAESVLNDRELMTRPPSNPRSREALVEINRQFYDPLWARSRLVSPERFNTWPLVRSLVAPSQSRLEVAPGLNPRLPIAGTRFVDMSEAAVAKLVEGGADATAGFVGRLPYADAAFDLIGAFDILEHVDDDDDALSELSRVAAPGATLLLSAPLHASRWTAFDELVGHGRRYRPDDLLTKLARRGWSVERSGVYGMQPRSSRLLDFVVWSFEHRRSRAIWWYSRVILPLGALFQKRLQLSPGMIDVENVDEVLLVCRKYP